ncbi:MAG: DMT family transporter [Rhodobacteraceae bacterium]|jgi:bacterial/archaeal transporter family-2 protein|nr:DMT family transporter [Paracoccaceae bacterium]
MTLPLPLTIAIVIAAGMALSTQAPLNAALARTLGQPVAAAAVSFGVGFMVLTLLSLLLGGPGPLTRLPAATWWQVTGGILGAFYVWAVIWGVPMLGVVTTVAALILGQMVAALVLDATGLFGLPVHAVSPTRLAAAGLVAAGLVMSRL